MTRARLCYVAAVLVGCVVALPQVAGASATSLPQATPVFTGETNIYFFADPYHAESYELTGALPISGTSVGVFRCLGYSTCDWSFTPGPSTTPTGSGQCTIVFPPDLPTADPETWSGFCTGTDSGNPVAFTWTATVEIGVANVVDCVGALVVPLLGCNGSEWDGVYQASTGSG